MKYIRTFSLREIESCLLSATMIIALFAVFHMFLVDLLSDKIKTAYSTISFLIPIAISHRFYLIEHKRPNYFWGRIINNAIITLFLVIFSIILMKLTNSFYHIGYYSNAVFMGLLLVYSSEFVLTLINTILKMFKWQIW